MSTPRLDLRANSRALETFGRRSLDALLPPALQSGRFSAWKPKGDDAAIAIGRGAWEQMTLNEYRSQVGFTDLLHAMTRLGLSRDSLQTMERLTRDEVVHVELCRRMVVGLGGSDIIPGEPQWVGLDESLPDMVERVIEMVTTSLCIGESLSCALLGAAAKAARDPVAKAVLTRMTADESIHGQSGFHYLAVLLPVLTKRRKKWLEQRASEAAVQAFGICLEPYDDVSHPFGALPYARLEPIMRGTWKRLIGPGFVKLGLDVREPD
ncbi:MAG: ferritin-like domain-containing protein [Archangium sp.]|nr:ferritin-like domain-containing protein [Archangium sp.]